MAEEEGEEDAAKTEVKEEGVDKDEVKARKGEKAKYIRGTRPKDMLTNLPSRPVDATGVSGRLLISVRSQGPVHGRTSGSQNQINEIPASQVN